MTKVDLNLVEKAQSVCEEELKRKVSRDEALVIGIVYQLAHTDGANYALKEIEKNNKQ